MNMQSSTQNRLAYQELSLEYLEATAQSLLVALDQVRQFEAQVQENKLFIQNALSEVRRIQWNLSRGRN